MPGVCRHGNNTEAVNLFLLLEIKTAAIFWIYSLFSASMFIAELREAPWVRENGNSSSRENLVSL